MLSEDRHAIVSIDDERPLISVKASGARCNIRSGADSLVVGVAIGAFEIEDLLVGPGCNKNDHLARSFQPLSSATLQVRITDAHG